MKPLAPYVACGEDSEGRNYLAYLYHLPSPHNLHLFCILTCHPAAPQGLLPSYSICDPSWPHFGPHLHREGAHAPLAHS